MISRARNTRSYMSTMYQVGVAGSHGLSTTDRTCLLGIRRGLQDLTGSNQQIEAAGSHEFGKPYRTCLEGIRTGLQDLTGSEHQIVHVYEVSGRSCRFSRVRTSDRTCI